MALDTAAPTGESLVKESVKEYYGRVLASSAGLKTSACCTDAAPPPHIAAALGRVHEEVLDRFYGCGVLSPPTDAISAPLLAVSTAISFGLAGRQEAATGDWRRSAWRATA
ncbi:hypothetical protein [Streptomyces dysideae]|uniref:Uncharacterized protein n=1 Tax=Streptomyces dysideae TaxID=909626 RepID=A0A101UQE5_9ACTN|nr:hypothetical protein [Streptomyces dysideae]KUO14979.1 hypothetical protein AQJ91_43740 [Streptomyces dysideae]